MGAFAKETAYCSVVRQAFGGLRYLLVLVEIVCFVVGFSSDLLHGISARTRFTSRCGVDRRRRPFKRDSCCPRASRERVRENHGVGTSSGGDGYCDMVLRDSRWRRVSTHSRVPTHGSRAVVRSEGRAPYRERSGSLPRGSPRRRESLEAVSAGFLASSRDGFREKCDRLDASRAPSRGYSSEGSGDSARSRRRRGELGPDTGPWWRGDFRPQRQGHGARSPAMAWDVVCCALEIETTVLVAGLGLGLATRGGRHFILRSVKGGAETGDLDARVLAVRGSGETQLAVLGSRVGTLGDIRALDITPLRWKAEVGLTVMDHELCARVLLRAAVGSLLAWS